MTAATIAQRTPLRDAAVEKAELVGDTDLLRQVVAGLKESVATDLIALSRIEDDIDAALGERAPATHEITTLSLRLRSAAAQLVDLVMEETHNRPQGKVADAVLRACEALAEALPTQGEDGLGHLRRVALAAQDILDQDVIADDVLDRAALLTGDEA
ncbi:DUF6415 family natural product biosynthesis protein [Streptomyces sp. NPDC093093]|uniref:DUF6415 family natural product biosynthesis protein n=1 Tax=Streptomyces sp. NPDC093093 TaxID=3366025 RepID=UPI00380E2555